MHRGCVVVEDVETAISIHRLIDPLFRSNWLRQIGYYAELHTVAIALCQLPCFLNAVCISVAADDGRTAACEQQRSRSSLATTRPADRHDLAGKSSGYRTLGRTPVRNTHLNFSPHTMLQTGAVRPGRAVGRG